MLSLVTAIMFCSFVISKFVPLAYVYFGYCCLLLLLLGCIMYRRSGVVCVSVCWSCKNGRTGQDAVWGVDSMLFGVNEWNAASLLLLLLLLSLWCTYMNDTGSSVHWLVKLCRDWVRTPMHTGQVYCQQYQSEGRWGWLHHEGETDPSIRRRSCHHGIRWAGTGKTFAVMVFCSYI